MLDDKTAAERVPTWLRGRVIGPLYFRGVLLATVVSLSAVQRSGFAASFIAASGALLIASTLALSALPLRPVRLTSGGVAAVSGAALSLQFGFMVTITEGKDDSGVSGGLLLALAFATAGAWTADLRLAARDRVDQQAHLRLQAERHDELLARLGAEPRPRRQLKFRDVALLWVALRLACR